MQSALLTADGKATCASVHTEEMNSSSWTDLSLRRYALWYTGAYSRDVGFTPHWIANAFKIAQDKYGVVSLVSTRGNDPPTPSWEGEPSGSC